MARNFKNSDYAKNKYSEGVVYTFVDGTEVEIKLSTAMEADSNVTVEKFQELKNVSDAIFEADDNSDDLYSKYVKTTYETIEDGAWLATKSLEEEYFDRLEDEALNEKVKRFANTKLTENQRRRFWLLLEGKSQAEIAAIEKCTQQNISASQKAIQKKFKKFFNKF